MKIAIIGAGNVGGALALAWAKKGNEVILGARNVNSDKVKKVTSKNNEIRVSSVSQAAADSEVILIAANPGAVSDIAKELGNVRDKIIIDAMNSISSKPEGFTNTFEALKSLTNSKDIVKCFNSTGFENMNDPVYGNTAADMFVAGDSEKAKKVAELLAKDAGFVECYDFGGDDRVALLEQFALAWVNLAIFQKHGRNIAFKVLKK